MRNRLFVVLLCMTSAASALAADGPATMRVDFFHSGNHVTELFSLDQVVVEQLPWAGNLAQPIDKTLRGKYLFEIVSDGRIKWSRSFSSIYGEWETTAEAREISRSFHESVRFPAQDAVFELVLRKRHCRQSIWGGLAHPAGSCGSSGAPRVRRVRRSGRGNS